MSDSPQASPFTDLASVEAWDAWFRWRTASTLHDASIEDTWRRVADSLVSVEPRAATTLRARLMEALASWRLLPDTRLLADAGTGRMTWDEGPLHAVLNAAVFAMPAAHVGAPVALAALADTAALAVQALDNAAVLARIGHPRLRIGIVGIADALYIAGLEYDSDAGRALAGSIARAASEGCLRENVALAATRGRGDGDMATALALAARRGAPQHLLQDAARTGLRHARTTAITSQPRLALLANDVADAADPLRGENHAHVIAAPAGQRMIRSSGYALNLLRSRQTAPVHGTLVDLPCVAQIAMRAALQPWLDEPITYPLLCARDPDDGQRREARRQATRLGLGQPVWRNPAALLEA